MVLPQTVNAWIAHSTQGKGTELNEGSGNRFSAQESWEDTSAYIQRDEHGTTVETSMEDSFHIILTSELVWDQMGLGTLTRADRGTLVKFHQPIWHGSWKCWEELRPVLRGLSTALHSGRLGLAHGRDFLRPQEGTGRSPTHPDYQEAWPLLEVTCWESSSRTKDEVLSESTGLSWVEGLPGLFLQSWHFMLLSPEYRAHRCKMPLSTSLHPRQGRQELAPPSQRWVNRAHV